MTVTTREMNASSDAVWAVIANGWCYAEWVVGAANIRDVDKDWPAVGAQLHHTVGVLPIHVQDTTEVTECRPTEFLALRARVRPIGTARLSFTLTQTSVTTCTLAMDEVVDRGFAAHFYGLIMKLAIRGRNTETLRRLEDLAAAD